MTEEYLWTGSLRRAIRNNRRDAHNRYVQLATVSSDGSPSVRTVVFRNLLGQPDRIVMVTDARSEKVADIRHDARGEICWYFSRTREQFRLGGTLELVGPGDDESRLETWNTLSPSARAQFHWPSPAASPVTSPRELNDDELLAPPDDFLLLVLDIHRTDHLQLRGSPQRRWLSTRGEDGSWRALAVNP